MVEILRATVFSPRYFPSFLGLTCTVSGLAGWNMMESIKRQFSGVKESLGQF